MAQVNVLYQSNALGVYRMRLSTAKLAVLPAATGLGAATDPAVEVKVSKSRRAFGIRPRGVTFSRLITATSGESFRRSVFFPCQTEAQQTAMLGQPTVTYQNKTYDSPVAVAES
jgi:hypothetical protein